MPLTFIKPCYWIMDWLSAESVMLDFGLGFDADFSQEMIERYGLRSFGSEFPGKDEKGMALPHSWNVFEQGESIERGVFRAARPVLDTSLSSCF